MKLAIVTWHLPPHVGGVADYASRFAYSLAQQGIEIAHLTSCGQASPLRHSSIQVYPTVRQWGWFGIFPLLLKIKRLNVDVINLQYVPHTFGRYGFNLAIATFPLLARLATGKSVITTCHELLDHRPSGLKARFLQAIYLAQASLILLGSSRVVVPAVWQERQLRRYYPRLSKKVRRIPVGSNIPVMPAGAGLETSPAGQHPPLTLGIFGTGHPWEQHEVAMKILKGLLDIGLQAKLLCIGDLPGCNPDRYRKLRRYETEMGLSGLIEWTGWIPGEEVSHCLQSVDIFLALHRSGITGRSSTLIAALAHGLPVIAAGGPDADDWLIESGAMEIVAPRDPAGAIQAATKLASDASLRKHLGQQALRFHQRHFSWEAIRAEFLDVIASLCPTEVPHQQSPSVKV